MNLRKYLSRPKMNVLLSEDEKRIGKFDVIADHFPQKTIYSKWTHNLEGGALVPFDAPRKCFALIDGHRVNAQLCLSYWKTLTIAFSAIENAIVSNQDQNLWSIAQGDNPAWCECDMCKDENPYDTLIYFVNRIANAHPDKQFHTLLYYKTEQVGTVVPLPNVMVMPTTIQLSKHRPYQEQKREDARKWRINLLDLLELTSNVGIWDYYGNFKHLLAPNPTLYSIGANMRWFRSLGIQNFIIQTDAAIGHEGSYWKEAWIYRMLKYPFLNPMTQLKIIWRREFGRAAKYVKEYYDLLDANKGNGDYLNNWRVLEVYRDSFLSDKMMARYYDVFSYSNLRSFIIQIDYACVEIGTAPKYVAERLGRFCARLGNVTVNEHKKSVKTYLKEKGL